MLDGLYIAAVGLEAQQRQLDAAANNFANMSTTAYKRQSVDFSAILDRATTGVGVPADSTRVQAAPVNVTHLDLSPGSVHATGRALDVAIQGPGFIEVNLPDQRTGYSRGGSLQINVDGGLSLAGGQALKADIRIPNGAANLQIQSDGSVTASLPGEATTKVLGQIDVVTFTNPDALVYTGNGVFTAPDAIAEPTRAIPGQHGTQLLAPQSLEASNVDMTTEIVSMTLVQRTYQLNSRVAQVADELMGMANNMRHE